MFEKSWPLPQRKKNDNKIPGVLEAGGLLATRGLDVEAAGRSMVGAPHRPPFLFAGLSVDRLPVAPVLRTVTVEDVHHVLQAVPCAEPVGL